MNHYHLILPLFAAFQLIFMSLSAEESELSTQQLKVRQPNWRHTVVDTFENGKPKTVIFYEPIPGSEKDSPVKLMNFFPEGEIESESDLIVLPENDPLAKELNTHVIPHGPYLNYTKERTTVGIAFYDRGRLHGAIKTFYENGSPKSTMSWKKGIQDGKYETFFENGKKSVVGNYTDDKRSGEWVRYFSNGERASEVSYENGVLNGNYIEWFENGNIKSKQTYVNGLLNNLAGKPAVTNYYSDRTVAETANYKAGQRVGITEQFFESGNKKYTVNYVSGTKQGLEKFYTEDGKILGQGQYNRGIPNGIHFKNHLNGQRAYVANFDMAGTTIQPVVEFDENGREIKKYHFVQGKLHKEYLTFHSNGKLQSSAQYTNGELNGTYNEFHPSGKIKKVSKYAMGKKIGLTEEWTSEGKKIAKKSQPSNDENVIQAIADGKNTEYFESTKNPKRITHYSKGQLHGTQETYFENRQKQASISYNDGLLDGPKTVWNSDGKIVEEAFYDHGNLEGKYYLLKSNQQEVVSNYKGNQIDGLHQVYYPYSPLYGKVKAIEANYVKGLPEGELSEYNEAGTKVTCTEYKKGLKDGLATVYGDDGHVRITAEFRGDNQNGIAIEYFSNGAVHKQANFIDDKKNGIETIYHQNEQIAATNSYLNGLKHGICKEWNAEGVLIFEGSFQEGKRHGSFKKYNNQGKLLAQQEYNDDKLIKKEKKE